MSDEGWRLKMDEEKRERGSVDEGGRESSLIRMRAGGDAGSGQASSRLQINLQLVLTLAAGKVTTQDHYWGIQGWIIGSLDQRISRQSSEPISGRQTE